MRRCLTQVVFSVAMILPLPALAQQNNCPPGAWFCADAEVQVPPPSKQASPPPAAEDQEEPAAPPPAKRTRRRRPPPPAADHEGQPPVVIYQPVAPTAPPPNVIVVTPGYRVYRRRPAPPPRPPAIKRRWRSEWGVNLRVEGMTFGRSKHSGESAAMGGVGLSLRYRPIPAFAIDAGVDVLVGNDYNGFRRTEVPFSLSGLLYLTPRSRVQLYLLGGMHFSRAEVRSSDPSPLLLQTNSGDYGESYTYFGGHGGAGLEFRVSRRVGINLDGIGFYRGRTDSGRTPEFIDPNNPNRTTNKSAGGMARAGITLWW